MKNTWPAHCCVLLALLVCLNGLPSFRNTLTDPVTVNILEDVTLTCTVKDVENYTVIWKRVKYGRYDVLSANTLKVTNDPRITVVHSPGGDDWVLSISQTRVSDSAQYVCETNSIPAVQVSILLTVKPPLSSSMFPLNHNYTECCTAHKVSDKCLGFCNLQNIVMGMTGASPQSCSEHLPVIASCMADGRNHTPCCIRERIPDICRDVCVGKFGLLNETIVNHYTCSRHSRATLACIAEGIEILPGPPQDVVVEPLSEKEVQVSWQLPKQNVASINHYILNVSELSTFDNSDPEVMDFEDSFNATEDAGLRRQGRLHESGEVKFTEFHVNHSDTSFLIKNLKPFTVYEIMMTSVNSAGASLPTYRVRTVTLLPSNTDNNDRLTSSNVSLPGLPNIRSCCAENGMKQERCLDLFCDPVKADVTNLTDMMICAPWINISVTCLANGVDHTPCCRQRGLPSLCLPLCQGNVSRIDFRYFRCIAYMDAYTSCLMQGYGVVPSSPMDVVLKTVSPHWAILTWEPPLNLTETVTSYNVHFRSLSADQVIYSTAPAASSPYLLDDLHPDTEYEVYVTAVNKYGAGEISAHLVFITQPFSRTPPISSNSPSRYNLTECCVKAQLNETCMPLCDYRARMADLQRLTPTCMSEFHKILKCGVGGRNHMPCCLRRMVTVNCASLCAGMVPQYTSTSTALCIPYIPDIIKCMEEGSDTLPGPIREFHASFINSSSVTLEWEAPIESNVTNYEVHYQGDSSESGNQKTATQVDEQVKNVTDTFATLENLQLNMLYTFYVVALNEFGSSMPSSILTVNTSSYASKPIAGVVSPPHSLSIHFKNSTTIILGWLPPDFSHPQDAIEYTVYQTTSNETKFNNLTTNKLKMSFSKLLPNKEYIFYVTASTQHGESWPSEMLRTWTDPVYPAFVEMPRIHPSTQIEEGGSMTVLCVATGTPMPTVSVYVNSVKYSEDVTRHMVTRISNVTREMDTVTCTADNGQGSASQATKHVQISFPPKLEAVRRTVKATAGDRVILECLAAGFPQPSMSWWRDQEKQRPVIQGKKYLSRVVQDENDDLVMQLIISGASKGDMGTYYCNAENPYGSTVDELYLQLDESSLPSGANVTACCLEKEVLPECLDMCVLDVDVESVSDRPQCLSELSKLMYCAADGSDHRRCCQTWGVPRRCIGWCQGKAVQSAPLCILAWSKQIVACFVEGKQALPGAPEHIRFTTLNGNSIRIEWDPPTKNPHTVQYYRVLGKPIGRSKSDKLTKNDTHGLSMVISGLRAGVTYEFSVKAANHHGSSLMSAPLQMTMTDVYLNVTYADIIPRDGVVEASTDDSSNSAAIAIGVILTIIIIVIAAIAYLYVRRKFQPRSLGGVSFENPSYMRENSGDAVQINGTHDRPNGSAVTGDVGWKSETLHTPENSENLYEVPNDSSSAKRSKTVF